MYVVVGARSAEGSKVATLLTELTVPETPFPPVVNVKLSTSIVAGSIASLKVITASLLIPTPLAESAGSLETTVGAVLSATVPVVKLHAFPLAKALPATSVIPVVIVALKVVLTERAAAGVKIAVRPTQVTLPETALPPWLKVKVLVVQLAGAIASLKIAVIFRLKGTPVAPSIGFVELTVGAVVSAFALSSPLHPTKKTANSNPSNTVLFNFIIFRSLSFWVGN